MKLKVMIPTGVLVHQNITKIVAEGINGSFCLLPRHVDYCAALVPGLITYESEDGAENFIAVDSGMLMKVGDEVLVSIRKAVMSPELETVRELIETEFIDLDEMERKAQAAMANLEANLVRRFLQWGENE